MNGTRHRLTASIAWLDAVRQDCQAAIRTLARAPGFAAAVVTVLAFGIGLAAAMFEVADTVLRRPLPVQDESRVVVLWGEAEGSVRNLPLGYQHFTRFRGESRALRDVAGTLSAEGWPHAVRDDGRTVSLAIAPVTGNFFAVLGTSARMGRLLRPADDRAGAAPVAVVSHAAWVRRFGADPRVLGRRLTLHERDVTYTIVGVAAPGLEYPSGTDLWVPLVPFGAIEVVPIGRLAPYATIARAAAELRASFRREPGSEWRGVEAKGQRLSTIIVGEVRPALIALSVAAALLFVTACLNAAGLLIARTLGRTHELAVRRALGAGRGRILRQTLIESALFAVLAGIVAAGASAALVRTLVALAPPELPRLEEIGLSARPVGMAAGLSAAAMLLFGLLLAASTLSTADESLRAGDRSATQTRGRQRAQRALVVLQVALAIVVLTAAGLLGRTLRALEHVNPGFDADRLAIVELAWPVESYGGAERVSALYQRLTSRLEALPDVVAAAPVNVVPFTGATGGWDGPLTIERRTGPSAVVSLAVVGPHYFRALRIGATRGRVFSDADRDSRERVIVISARIADRLWPGADAIGRRIALGRPHTAADWWTVVGVVPETRYRALRHAAPTVYFPVDQFGGPIDMIRTLVVRTVGEPGTVARSIREAVRQEDPRVVVVSAEPMQQLLANQRARPRLDAMLLAVFAAGALLLAAVGLYAVLACAVRQRTRELAIRHALGATPSGLALLVVRQAVATTGLGLALGIAAALSCAGLLRALLFGVSPVDPVTLASVAAILLATGVVASYLPARRAAAADPATVLRVE